MGSADIQLEAVRTCPICGSDERRVFYDELRDELFSAPGLWSLFRCLDCRAAYLDPRPTPESTSALYETYYTHATAPPVPPPAPPANGIGAVKERLRNGYLSRRFGFKLDPSWKLAHRLVPLFFPRHRVAFDTSVRHLPLPHPNARLLDVGCGGGEFLVYARSVGWQVTGIEIDPVAAAIAAERGIEIIPTPLNEIGWQPRTFEAVTMNHVIEHLHDPRETLREAHRILKPGGLLWVATPNIDSPLRKRLGRSWRGLEAPRHLVLFGKKALTRLIEESGFVHLSWPRTYPLTRWMLDASPTHGRSSSRHPKDLEVRLFELGSFLTQTLSEQLVALAMKPGEARS
jgi:2-polyprenyl-3-methyl-5-hydroxy-6-metoxy-1,4-benzoquinol methylase